MRPRLISRGNIDKLWALYTSGEGFNEAATDQSRKWVKLGSFEEISSGFNEAATDQSRKCQNQVSLPLPRPASMRPRLISRGNAICLRCCKGYTRELQ